MEVMIRFYECTGITSDYLNNEISTFIANKDIAPFTTEEQRNDYIELESSTGGSV